MVGGHEQTPPKKGREDIWTSATCQFRSQYKEKERERETERKKERNGRKREKRERERKKEGERKERYFLSFFLQRGNFKNQKEESGSKVLGSGRDT